jgi:hypothetical protein
MADIRFNIRWQDFEARISPASVKELAQLAPIDRLDLLQDVIGEAITHYNAAMKDLRAEWGKARERG